MWRIEWNLTGTILASSGDDNYVRMWKQQFDVFLIEIGVIVVGNLEMHFRDSGKLDTYVE